MSRVTNFILAFGCCETEAEGTARDSTHLVIENIEAKAQVTFCRVDGYASGPKFMEASVYVAAQNHADVTSIIEAVQKAPWRYPAQVTFLVKEQEDDAFRYVSVLTVGAAPVKPLLEAVTDEKHSKAWIDSVGKVMTIAGRRATVLGCVPDSVLSGKYLITAKELD